MSNRLIELFLFDIVVAIAKIETTVSHFNNVDDLKHDYLSWDSIIREFEIIGEASNHLLKSNLLAENYRTVVDFRNVLIHGYFGIEEDEVWDVIHKQLHLFKKLISSKIQRIDSPLKQEILDAIIEENSHLDFVLDALKTI